MAEHSDLISEMPFLEKMNTEERLKLARKRRSQQLKRWAQREKEYGNHLQAGNSLAAGGKAAGGGGRKKSGTSSTMNNCSNEGDLNVNGKAGKRIHFIPSVTLLEAASRNDIDEVRRLLMLGVDPDSTNEDGLTALHQCCIDNLEDMMLLLIEFGANVNAADSEGWRPLHAASTCGHSNLIKILIDKGADLLAVNADGNMPYDICEDEQTLDYIESEMAKRGVTQELIDTTRAKTENRMLADLRMLAEQGYELNFKDEQGATPLHIAAANGYMSVVQFLVENNACLDECDHDLWQPIHCAACWGYIDVIEYLLQAGADLDAKTKNGETPFDICEDPDLKARILQLKSEMESKRSVSSNRLRRSHSQNTRSHSIRRTSVREKAQIAKREAIEEAKLWHEKTTESIDVPQDSDQDSEAHFAAATHMSPINLNNIDVGMIDEVESAGNITLRGEKGNGIANNIARSNRMSDGYSLNHKEQYKNNNNSNNNSNNNNNTLTNGSDSLKVEIHVTVNSSTNSTATAAAYNGTPPTSNGNGSAGTLIDLKKQRSEKHRSSLTTTAATIINHGRPLYGEARSASVPSETSLHHPGRVVTTPPNSCHPHHHHPPGKKMSLPTLSQPGKASHSTPTSSMKTGMTSNHCPPAHDLRFDSPPSPSTVKKRFRGNPSELIGEGSDRKGCCCIS